MEEWVPGPPADDPESWSVDFANAGGSAIFNIATEGHSTQIDGGLTYTASNVARPSSAYMASEVGM